jgi:uncharacterized FlaG/YvyC family protein
MTPEISMIAGIHADSLPSPVAESSSRSGSHSSPVTSENPKDSGAPAPNPVFRMENLPDNSAENKEQAEARLERIRKTMVGQNTKLSFERDGTDGHIYLHVRDKTTGEEILRIPEDYLKNSDPSLLRHHEVDERI